MDSAACPSTCARGLPGRLSDHSSWTLPLAPQPVLGDCLDNSPTIARGLCRSPLDLCSETASTTLRPQLVDSAARPSICAWGLPRPLSDHSSGTLRLNYMRLATRIQLGYSFSFRPCYKAHTSPSSKLGDYIDTMHLSVHLVSLVRRLDSQLNWEFFLDPGTTCLHHLLQGLGTKWAHFTLR